MSRIVEFVKKRVKTLQKKNKELAEKLAVSKKKREDLSSKKQKLEKTKVELNHELLMVSKRLDKSEEEKKLVSEMFLKAKGQRDEFAKRYDIIISSLGRITRDLKDLSGEVESLELEAGQLKNFADLAKKKAIKKKKRKTRKS